MLSSKLGNSSELFSSCPEDFSIIKQNKKQKLSCENLGHGEKKVAGKKSYAILDVSVQPTRKWIALISQSER